MSNVTKQNKRFHTGPIRAAGNKYTLIYEVSKQSNEVVSIWIGFIVVIKMNFPLFQFIYLKLISAI